MDTSKAKKKQGNKKQQEEREFLEVTDVEVKNVRVVSGNKGDTVFFTLKLNGITIYNVRIAEGKNGDFISFPQYKAKDNNYYSYVYAALKDEDTKGICDLVQKALDGDEE